MLTRCVTVPCAKVNEALHRAKQRTGVRRNVRLLAHDTMESPAIWCWSDPPVILNPSEFASRLSIERMSDVFCHELAHLVRRDHLTKAFADLCVAVIAWNPLAWWARRELAMAAERACDAIAATTARTPADYAETLLGFAEQRKKHTLGLAVVASAGSLTGRVRSILAEEVSAKRIDVGLAALVCAAAIVLSSLLASAQRANGIEYRFEPVQGNFFVHASEEPNLTDREIDTTLLPRTMRWVQSDR